MKDWVMYYEVSVCGEESEGPAYGGFLFVNGLYRWRASDRGVVW